MLTRSGRLRELSLREREGGREGEGDGGGGAGAGAGRGGEGEGKGELVVISQLLHFATANSPLTTTLLSDHFP